MGRPTTYTTAIGNKIAKLVSEGNYFTVACEQCQIPRTTGSDWRRNNPEFSSLIKQAEAKSEQALLSRIDKASKGQKVVRRKYSVDAEGNKILIEETETTETSWQSAAWLLERKFPDRWSRKTMDLVQALQVLVSEGIAPPELIEIARDGVTSLTEQLRAAFQAIEPAPASDSPQNSTTTTGPNPEQNA